MANKYILFDLNDEKAKKLGEVISNPSCKKIVNLLAEKELSISDISREFGMPMNSVQYNIEKLLEAGLIEESKSFWSVKGKKMPSYKVVNKMIVISPKKSSGIYNKLKGIIPVVFIAGILTSFIAWYYQSSNFVSQSVQKTVESVAENTDKLMTGGSSAGSSAGAVAGSSAASVSQEAINNTISNYTSSIAASSPWIWFGLGALVAVIAFLIWNYKKL